MALNQTQAPGANLRVALLTNSLSPHTLPLCEVINERVGELRAFVSAATDTFHGFPRPRASFPIVVQRSLNIFRLRHRTAHFALRESLHIPLDTLQLLWRYQPDVILSCQFGARTLFALLYCLVRPRTRLILWAALSTHTEGERSAFRNLLRRWMLRHVDAAFANGRSGEQYLRKLGLQSEVCTVPYAIDDALFRAPSYHPAAAERRLLFCGRVDATKGALRFCGALHRWCAAHPERRVRLTIIGNGPDIAAIRALPALPNLTLKLLARMPQPELAAHYREADLFVFPSLMDEWGVVVNEAMSAALPVLGSIYSQAAVELIADGANGWLFDPLSEGSLHTGIDRALTASAEELQEMSAYARCAVAEVQPEIVGRRAVETILRICSLEAKRTSGSAPDLSLGAGSALPVP